MRFYRIAESGTAFYLSATDTLFTWRLNGVERSLPAVLVVKGHAATTWEHAAESRRPWR
jgi:hypothetical protein